MYYFAYGSNLNHYQMKSIRCIGSKYIQNTFLQDYQLSFCHPKKENIFGQQLLVIVIVMEFFGVLIITAILKNKNI